MGEADKGAGSAVDGTVRGAADAAGAEERGEHGVRQPRGAVHLVVDGFHDCTSW